MIKFVSSSENHRSQRIYYDYFPSQSRNYFLLLDHFQEDPFVNKMQEYIVGEFLKLKLSDYQSHKLLSLLKEFFVKLNWQLYSGFSQRQDLERGMSLAFLLNDDEKLYLVMFGRFSAGKVINDKLEKVGEWVDPAVLSYDKIGLLGSLDQDIAVKVHEIDFEKGSSFLILKSREALELEKKGIHQLSIKESISSQYQKKIFTYIHLENCRYKALNHKYWVRKRRVNRTAIILLIIIILSSVYAFWGTNIIDDLLSRFKFQSREFTRNELKEQFILLQEQAEDLLSEISQDDMQLAIIPKQKIIMEKAWEQSFPQSSSSIPVFDYNQIYVPGQTEIYAIDKTTRNIVWQHDFGMKVEVLRVVDANRLIVGLAGDKIHCLNRLNGESQWQQDYYVSEFSNTGFNLNQISLNQYRQLDESIFLLQKQHSIALGLIRDGKIISELDTGDKIRAVSSYDLLDKCIYLTADKKLIKINIKVII